MATFTSDVVAGNQTFKPFPGGTVGVRYGKFTTTAAPNVNDVYQMCDVFAGETVVDVKLKSTDLDTGSGIVYDVGNGGAADQYIDGSTIGQAGGSDDMDANVAPVAYTADDTIDVTIQVVPAGDVAVGTIELWVFVA